MNDVRKKWIFTAILAVIEILMTVTDLGYFVIGSSAFTVLHIPVFIAVILAGLPQGFLIADVSGKGVPAALFMMRAMTLVSNHVLEGDSPAEALQHANVELCDNNEKGMFVTLWLGILDLQNGTLEFANAAHNPPALRKTIRWNRRS